MTPEDIDRALEDKLHCTKLTILNQNIHFTGEESDVGTLKAYYSSLPEDPIARNFRLSLYDYCIDKLGRKLEMRGFYEAQNERPGVCIYWQPCFGIIQVDLSLVKRFAEQEVDLLQYLDDSEHWSDEGQGIHRCSLPGFAYVHVTPEEFIEFSEIWADSLPISRTSYSQWLASDEI